MPTDAIVVAAHPDDAELGMGGTIAALTAAGHSIVLVDLTDGEPTPYGSPEIRLKEAGRASEILGIKRRINLGLKNREVFDSAENRRLLASVFREYQPKVIFTHYADDAHPDHTEAHKLVTGARFYSKLVKTDMPHAPFYPGRIFYFFSIHMKIRFQPSFIFDISPFIERKFEAIRVYKSQFLDHAGNISVMEKLRTENAYWGIQAGTEYGEPFFCRENLRVSSTDGLLGL